MSKYTGTGRSVLVVDDELNVRMVLAGLLTREKFDVITAGDVEEALPSLEKDLTCIITDLMMPGRSGMDLLDTVKAEKPEVPVIMITGHGDVETAVSAIKRGAYDFITKPFDETELLGVIGKAVSQSVANNKVVSSYFEDSTEPFPGFVGRSPAITKIIRTVRKIAPTESSVLILGETGVGKELVARAVHQLSQRKSKPLVKVNCSVIPDTLVESELFGHEKGAFTGAVTAKPGRFELADGGTVFLDEIGEIPENIQAKLLNVLQDRCFERVGGIKTVSTDIRVISATNRDLATEVGAGRFRSDLYYRLNVVPIKVPPLRERREDIEPTASYFLRRYGDKYGKGGLELAPEVAAAFAAYSWPGNVRELENVLERMIVMAEDNRLGAEILPEEFGETVSSALEETLLETVDGVTAAAEKQMILDALRQTEGNRTRAAQALGISRRTLQNKLKKYLIK